MNILFVTAYRDIGRTKWRHRPRSNAAYSSAFSRLRQALKYPLVLYTNNETLNGLPVGLTDNMPIVNIDSTNPSFFNKYLEEETRIMNLPSFRKLIPRQKQNKPEFNYSKYTLVTHMRAGPYKAQPGAREEAPRGGLLTGPRGEAIYKL